jgi:hypothetical protein
VNSAAQEGGEEWLRRNRSEGTYWKEETSTAVWVRAVPRWAGSTVLRKYVTERLVEASNKTLRGASNER